MDRGTRPHNTVDIYARQNIVYYNYRVQERRWNDGLAFLFFSGIHFQVLFEFSPVILDEVTLWWLKKDLGILTKTVLRTDRDEWTVREGVWIRCGDVMLATLAAAAVEPGAGCVPSCLHHRSGLSTWDVSPHPQASQETMNGRSAHRCLGGGPLG